MNPMVELKLVSDSDANAWNVFVNQHHNASIYHLYEWKSILQETYNFQHYYYFVLIEGKLIGLLPLIHQKSIITNILYTPIGGFLFNRRLLEDEFEQICKYINDHFPTAELFLQHY